MLNYTSFTHSRSNSIQRLFLLLSLVFVTTISSAQRAVIPLNNDWLFRFSHEVHKESGHKVALPHTWNAVDALSGKPDYKRGIGNYSRSLFVPASWQGRRIFIRFEGANTTTDLFLNGKHIGEHRGGYGAFIFELTDKIIYGAKNQLLVRVNNAEQLDVMPLVGDFNFYGGIYRNVALLLTNDVCISPLDYASPGIYLRQIKVDAQQADVKADVMLDNPTDKTQQVEVAVEVFSGDKAIIKQQKSIRLEAQAMVEKHTIPFTIRRPHLWNGTQDPFIYKVKVSLWQGKTLLDEVEQPLGLRSYKVDPARGFFLNGHHLQLHGVCRHQDRAVVGNALAPEDIREDVKLMCEMGVNAVRLAHYPHSSYAYDQMDRAGIVTWAEIPFVGPGGYADKGFVDSER
ncbi:MAG: glycoside hydrolase family 2 protein, partial [Segatella oris]